MSHLLHIAKNKKTLEQRSEIIRLIREFFWSEKFLEVETPLLLRLPGQEPYLSPMRLDFHDEKNNTFTGYLHTSPEYTMKKMLAAGFENIFSVTKTFRDCESFGGTHNPEFTMIEWYRKHTDMVAIMDDCEKLFSYVGKNVKNISLPEILTQPWERIHMRDLWQQFIGINLDEYLTVETMRTLCIARGFTPSESEPYEDLFYRIFLNEIEPHLGKEKPVIVHHYPKCMAALAKIDANDAEYAERFEIYIGGLEIANAFSELTDAVEQRARLQEEQDLRKNSGKDVFALDEDFLEALPLIGQAAGIALGVDRLVQLFLGCKNIDDVIALPASELFT